MVCVWSIILVLLSASWLVLAVLGLPGNLLITILICLSVAVWMPGWADFLARLSNSASASLSGSAWWSRLFGGGL
jgi:hypothetical protein